MKIIRTSTVPLSLNLFCRGFLAELTQDGFEVVVVSSPLKELDEISEREKVRTIPVSMCRYFSPFRDLKSLYKLIRVFSKEKPTIVHSITPKAGLLSMMAAWLCRVPVRMHTFTGLVFPTSTGIKRRVLMLTDKITCLCATHINPEGQGVKNDLENFGITSKPLTILGNGNIKGVDADFYNVDNPEIKELPKDTGKYTYIYIGRILGDKGVNELICAFDRLSRERRDVSLIVVGMMENEYDPVSAATLDSIRINPAIRYVGFQSDIRPWLKISDALVLPSYREGFPNVVLEAAAMNVPAIVTDVNGSREIITHNVNGLVVPPKDTESLFEAMKFAIDHPKTWAKMAEVARTSVLSRFEQSYVRKALKDYYRSILNQ